MKRILCAILSLILLLGLVGCAVRSPQTKQTEASYDIVIVNPTEKAGGETAAPTTTSAGSEAPSAATSPASTEVPATAAPTQTEAPATTQTEAPTETSERLAAVEEDGWYDSRDEVHAYLRIYGHLPDNYITKRQAEALGWSGGSLEPYAPGKSIGGGRFGNYEGLLPDAPGRKWTECDIDTAGRRSRGAKRIVFSNDGLIYYTDDHYESFTLLYGGD